ncbi:hypothetical protein HDU93_003270 [Gonapodya sp. JEL0774]|nr:hypothetical protein HDU93_003270 [Gonapodya sp. JEL0774]
MAVFSHEELYRSVYTICCRGQRAALLSTLLAYIDSAFERAERDINAPFEIGGGGGGGLDPALHGVGAAAGGWLARFARALADGVRASEVTAHVFAYLDRIQVRATHPAGLRDLLLSHFQHRVLSSPATEEKLFVALHLWERGTRSIAAGGVGEAGVRVIGVDNDVVGQVVCGVYEVCKENFRFNPPLFTRMLPLHNPPLPLPALSDAAVLTSQYDQALTRYNLAEIRRDLAEAAVAAGLGPVAGSGSGGVPDSSESAVTRAFGGAKRTAAERSAESPQGARRHPGVGGGSGGTGGHSGRDEGKIVKKRNVAAVGGVDLVAPAVARDVTEEPIVAGPMEPLKRSNVTRGDRSGLAVRSSQGDGDVIDLGEEDAHMQD